MNDTDNNSKHPKHTITYTERETIDGIFEKGGVNQEASECGETSR